MRVSQGPNPKGTLPPPNPVGLYKDQTSIRSQRTSEKGNSLHPGVRACSPAVSVFQG